MSHDADATQLSVGANPVLALRLQPAHPADRVAELRSAKSKAVSRFKKLNRIEDAIKHQNKPELEWALTYAQDRFNTSTMKQHEKEWRRIVQRIQEALDALSE